MLTSIAFRYKSHGKKATADCETAMKCYMAKILLSDLQYTIIHFYTVSVDKKENHANLIVTIIT